MKPNDFLNEAIKAIGDRAAERDIDEERSAERAAHMFSALTGRDMTELEAWQFMCCLKLVRSATGKFKADDFIDLAGYAALAGEAAEKDSQNPLDSSRKLWDEFWEDHCWKTDYDGCRVPVGYDKNDPMDYEEGYPSPCDYGWTTSPGATDWSKHRKGGSKEYPPYELWSEWTLCEDVNQVELGSRKVDIWGENLGIWDGPFPADCVNGWGDTAKYFKLIEGEDGGRMIGGYADWNDSIYI